MNENQYRLLKSLGSTVNSCNYKECVENITLVCGKDVNSYTEGELIDLKNSMMMRVQSLNSGIVRKKEHIDEIKGSIETSKNKVVSVQNDIRELKKIIASRK